jgi:RNA polymerase sigma factor (sigma-70 family)
LDEAMALLNERQRKALTLRYWYGMSEREVAAALGVAAGTVKSINFRALRTLRQALQERSDHDLRPSPLP